MGEGLYSVVSNNKRTDKIQPFRKANKLNEESMRKNPKVATKTPIKIVASASTAAPRQPDDPGVQKNRAAAGRLAAKKPGGAVRPVVQPAQPKR